MKRLLLFIFVLLSTCITAQTSSFSLAQAIEYALQNQLRIQNAQVGIADADARIEENRATALPQVKGSFTAQSFLILPKSVLPKAFAEASIPRDSLGNLVRPVTKKDRQLVFGVRHSFTPGIEVSQLLFSGSYLESKRAALAYKDYAQQNLQVERKAVENQVQLAYLPALLITESVATLTLNITNLAQLRFETNEIFKAGFTEQLDVDRLDLTLANLKTERENLLRQREIVLNVLKFAMGYPMGDSLTLSDNVAQLLQNQPTAADIEGDLNFTTRPELGLLENAKRLQQIEYDVIRAGRLPSVAAFGSFQMGFSGDQVFKELFAIPVSAIGLSVNVPIYDSGIRRNQLQRSKLKMQLLNNQVTETNRAFNLQARNARVSYKSASERLVSQQKTLELAERIFQTAQTKYKTGVGSSLEIVQAEQSLFQSQQNVISAKFDVLQSQIGLQQALGK